MRKIGLCSFGLIAALAPLRADWKITTAYTFDGQRSVRTEYFKGGLWRSESETSPGNGTVVVVDQAKHRQIIWDVGRREYVIMQMQPRPVPASESVQPATAPPVLQIDISTTDTGDRQSMFGRTARHLISHEKRYMTEPGSAPVLQSESEADGWYVDVPGLPAAKSANAFAYLAFTGRQPIVKVNHTGPAPTGLPVLVSTTTRNFVGQEQRTSVHTIRVTDLFEGTLSPQLFEPPAGFQQVAHLSNAYQPRSTNYLEMWWESFENWLVGLFS